MLVASGIAPGFRSRPGIVIVNVTQVGVPTWIDAGRDERLPAGTWRSGTSTCASGRRGLFPPEVDEDPTKVV